MLDGRHVAEQTCATDARIKQSCEMWCAAFLWDNSASSLEGVQSLHVDIFWRVEATFTLMRHVRRKGQETASVGRDAYW